MQIQPARFQIMPPAQNAKPVRLVTPDFEAVCDRMNQRGDVAVLEGNVLLLCRKHAQPIRIEGSRIVVNMRDGSFNVESDVRPTPAMPAVYPLQRTSGLDAGGFYMNTGMMPTPIRMDCPPATNCQTCPKGNCESMPALTPEMVRELMRQLGQMPR